MIDDKQHLALRIERRQYMCDVCGVKRVIEVRRIEKWVAVCSHGDTQGETLPIMQLREEGVLVSD